MRMATFFLVFCIISATFHQALSDEDRIQKLEQDLASTKDMVKTMLTLAEGQTEATKQLIELFKDDISDLKNETKSLKQDLESFRAQLENATMQSQQEQQELKNEEMDEPELDACAEIDYKNLTSANRKVSFFDRNIEYCDKEGTSWQNSDWYGPGWYRFTDSAGSKMPESPAPIYYCGTEAPGWVKGGHPTGANETRDSSICFHWRDNECAYSVPIQIKNCGEYHIYNLPNAPNCNLRYCGSD